MGLEIVNWMILRGAKHFLLSSRSGIKNNYQRANLKRIDDINKRFQLLNVDIQITTHNANNMNGANKLIEEALNIANIGGIFHLAVVLNGAFLDNQTFTTFRETCEPKVNALMNLDKLTRKLCPQLEYFVAFSSVSCGRGM